ncbi:TetR family transcriptional regulator [Demequina pelophila]|uniref:TetR family transcriptional regulator n=1 Tax=Demequina pelophila TaxID=1638984 RepID=UPI0007853468|nr:TetR family transcriptional regulator [Demequina pelophila]
MDQPRRPGRPQIADPDRIALEAVHLFAERGYDAVTMDDVAAASDISRRTLFRYFEHKQDLVWRDFRSRFIEAGAPDYSGVADGIDGIRESAAGGPPMDAEEERLLRTRMQIIGANPDVFGAGAEAMEVLRKAMAEHFRKTLGALEAEVASSAAVSCMVVAAVWWANQDEVSLADATDAALVRLRDGLG